MLRARCEELYHKSGEPDANKNSTSRLLRRDENFHRQCFGSSTNPIPVRKFP
jgi:hypothetical protein